MKQGLYNKTIEGKQMKEKIDKIINKLIENGWDINKVEYQGRYPIEATKKFANILITMEQCSCHGGRMWITNNHTNSYRELTHETYDESLGIVDSTTELDYIIENEMIDAIKDFDGFIYKLTKINEYGSSDGTTKESVTYYKDMKLLARSITERQEDDIFKIDKVIIKYPNTKVYSTVERVNKKEKYSWEKNRIWFVQKKYRKDYDNSEFELDSEFEMYVSIFEK